VRGRGGVVQRLRFLVEGQLRAIEHPHARSKRFELALEVITPQYDELVRAIGLRQIRDVRDQPLRAGADVRERRLLPSGLGLPFGRPVERIDIVRIVLAEREDQLHVPFGNGVHRSRLTRLRGRGRGGGEQEHGGNPDESHRCSHSRIVAAAAASGRSRRGTAV
jgi:hypothetical protein